MNVAILVLGLLGQTAPSNAAGTPRAAEVIKQLPHQPLIDWDNVEIISEWEFRGRVSQKKGSRLELERKLRQEISADKLGRVRFREIVLQKSGIPVESPESDVDQITETLFDGEKTVYSSYAPGKDQFGKPYYAEKDQKPGLKKGYRSAQIHDGLFPQPHGPWSSINPVDMVRAVNSVISRCAEKQIDIRVKPSRPGGAGHDLPGFTLTFKPTDEIDSRKLTYETYFGPQPTWLYTGQTLTDDRENVVEKESIEYKRTAEGVEVPVGGYLKMWMPNVSEPFLDWRFHVLSCKYNSIADPDQVFKPVLEPGTSVSDIRYNVTYRVGDEAARDADLTRLADEAKRAKVSAEAITSAPSPKFAASHWEWPQTWTILVAAGLGIILTAGIIALRGRLRGDSRH